MRKKSLLKYKIEPMTGNPPLVIGSASMRLALKCILWVYRLHAVLYGFQILSRRLHPDKLRFVYFEEKMFLCVAHGSIHDVHFLLGCVFSRHSYYLHYRASILHHDGGLHKVWDGHVSRHPALSSLLYFANEFNRLLCCQFTGPFYRSVISRLLYGNHLLNTPGV